MHWIPLALAVLLTAILAVLNSLYSNFERRDLRSYRAKYLQVLSRLDWLTRRSNLFAADLHKATDVELLKYCQQAFDSLGLCLQTAVKLSPFAGDVSLLHAVFDMASECEQRLSRVGKWFAASREGGVDWRKLFNIPTDEPRGCYFCSRPYLPSRFSQVRVRIDSEVMRVHSCNICRDELKHSKNVKVLHFMVKGKPLHWSNVADYNPSADYWNINRRGPVSRRTRLTLLPGVDTRPPS